jgi:hypothetical protein
MVHFSNVEEVKQLMYGRKPGLVHQVDIQVHFGHLNFMQFHYRLIVHQRPLICNRYKLYQNLMVFDGLSNDNEITKNLNDHQSKSRITHL